MSQTRIMSIHRLLMRLFSACYGGKALNGNVKHFAGIDDSFSASQKPMVAWKRFLSLDNSQFVDLFVEQLKSTLQCTVCGHASATFDPFWDLGLPIRSGTDQVRLQTCFDLFAKEEILDGDEKPTYSKYRKRQKCTKSLSIQRFPRILVVMQGRRILFSCGGLSTLNLCLSPHNLSFSPHNLKM